MKRCPQCEFIYEDDQARCDMDGEVLIYDTEVFLLPANAVSGVPGSPAKARWGSVILLAIAGGVLIGVIGVDYYNFRHPTASRLVTSKREEPAAKLEDRSSELQTSTPSTTESPALPSSAAAPAIANPLPSRSIRNSGTARSATPTLKPTPLSTPLPKPGRIKPLPASLGRHPVSGTPKPAGVNEKKESKLESLLKRTGRILKKPFKL